MMNIKVDWDKLKLVHEHLTTNINAEAEIIFIMMLQNGAVKKSIVKFKDFLNFFWAISENPRYNVQTLVIQDKEGRILYRHKELTSGNEEIPFGGNVNVILQWNTLTQNEKDLFTRLTIAQFNAYER